MGFGTPRQTHRAPRQRRRGASSRQATHALTHAQGWRRVHRVRGLDVRGFVGFLSSSFPLEVWFKALGAWAGAHLEAVEEKHLHVLVLRIHGAKRINLGRLARVERHRCEVPCDQGLEKRNARAQTKASRSSKKTLSKVFFFLRPF